MVMECPVERLGKLGPEIVGEIVGSFLDRAIRDSDLIKQLQSVGFSQIEAYRHFDLVLSTSRYCLWSKAMLEYNDPSYYATRAAQALRLAAKAKDPAIAAIHLEMAARYRETATLERSAFPKFHVVRG